MYSRKWKKSPTLNLLIMQVELSRPVQDQILNELNQLTDVCDVLKSLHIAIGFLSSAGGDPSMPVQEYLHSGLKMAQKDGLKSGKVNRCNTLIIIIIHCTNLSLSHWLNANRSFSVSVGAHAIFSAEIQNK